MGGAVPDADFIARSGVRIRWRPEETEPRELFQIMIVDDEIAESDEYLEVTFVIDSTGYAFPRAVGRVTILDNDGGPTTAPGNIFFLLKKKFGSIIMGPDLRGGKVYNHYNYAITNF